jgi:Predicted Zn peptidase
MSGGDFRVPPMKWNDIGLRADGLRANLGLTETPLFPVIDVLEKILPTLFSDFQFMIGDEEEMEGAEGYTDPGGAFIMLHEKVYAAALGGDGRARFTAAHELGHWMLHTNVPLMRIDPNTTVDAYMRAEPQANQFAAELLMPRRLISSINIEFDLMTYFGVSYAAASHRLNFLRRRNLIL